MVKSSTSFDIRNTVRYESIHDVRDEHWQWFIEAAAPDDGDLILDCGCGYGACTKELLDRCKQSCFIVDLLDESHVQIERAKLELESAAQARGDVPSTRSVLDYIADSVEHFSRTTSRRYDKIFLKMVLHEVPISGQESFLNELFGMLKPGGVLIVWDLALEPSVASFFREVVREKDRLLGFRTMQERRYFLTAGEFLDLAKRSKFKVAETTALFDCDFHSDRRVECEFKSQYDKYNAWLQFIKRKSARVDAATHLLLRLKWETGADDQEHAHFVIQRALWRLRRPDCLSVVNTLSGGESFEAHLAPSSFRPDLPERVQCSVQGGIESFGVHELLPGHRGLVRVTTFHLLKNGRMELCKDGTDFIYSYGGFVPESHEKFVKYLLEGYYRHMAYIYHRQKNGANGSSTLTDFLNEAGRMSPDASWLRIMCPAYDEKTRDATIEITLCSGSVNITDDVLVIHEYNAAKEKLLSDYPIPDNVLGHGGQTTCTSRIVCGENQSMDSVVQKETDKLTAKPYSHFATKKFHWKHNRLNTCPVDSLIGFAVFMECSSMKYGCYVLPPSPLDSSKGRAMPAAVFFSSQRILSSHQEQVLFAFTTKMWTEMRGLQLLSQSHTFLNTAYREEILNKSTERLFFVKNILFPLLCNEVTVLDPLDLRKGRKASGESEIFDQWATAQGRAFTTKDVNDLVLYVLSEDEGLSGAERLALEGIEHAVREQVLRDKDGSDLGERIAQAKEIAQRGGRLLTPIASLLESAEMDAKVQKVPESAKVKCCKVIKLYHQLKANERTYIKQLCAYNQHNAQKNGDWYKNSLKPESKNAGVDVYPKYRFSLSDFDNAVAALRHNARESAAYSLRYVETNAECIFTWIESSKLTWTFSDFKSRLLSSAKRDGGGIHRGLPCVILFGLESKARVIEVLCNGEWMNLWPLGALGKARETEYQDYNYGIRITF